MSQLSMLTQQNASASEELAATSEEMSAQAQSLQRTVAFFRVESYDGATHAVPAPVPRPSTHSMGTSNPTPGSPQSAASGFRAASPAQPAHAAAELSFTDFGHLSAAPSRGRPVGQGRPAPGLDYERA